jgi:hypothetical protein
VTKARKPKRFEYFWVRKWWSPETAELIQSWGDTLAAIADEVARRGKPRLRIVRRQVAALEELKRSSTLEAIAPAANSATANADELWWRFNHAVQSCAGWRPRFYEDLALLLARQGDGELALRVIAIDEFFEPNQKGIARHHVEAVTGKRKQAIRALVRTVWDPQRTWSARVRALSCLAELTQEEFEEESKWLLIAAEEEGDSLAASEIRSLIEWLASR